MIQSMSAAGKGRGKLTLSSTRHGEGVSLPERSPPEPLVVEEAVSSTVSSDQTVSPSTDGRPSRENTLVRFRPRPAGAGTSRLRHCPIATHWDCLIYLCEKSCQSQYPPKAMVHPRSGCRGHRLWRLILPTMSGRWRVSALSGATLATGGDSDLGKSASPGRK